MAQQEKETPAVEKQQEEKSLPASYFQDLLNAPACKRGEKCDNCGRCER